MIFFLAALLAMLVGLLDFATTGIGFARGATFWLLLRLCADGAIGAATVFPVRAAYHHLPFWVLSLIAATAGTALLRSYLLTLGKGEKSTQAGPIYIYDKLKSLTDDRISTVVSVAKVSWLKEKVAPALAEMQCDAIITDIIIFIRQKNPNYNRRELAAISSDLKGANGNDANRIVLYQRILANGAEAELKQLVRNARG
jgi:hypothetical protein